jgi:hypothetical protein
LDVCVSLLDDVVRKNIRSRKHLRHLVFIADP